MKHPMLAIALGATLLLTSCGGETVAEAPPEAPAVAPAEAPVVAPATAPVPVAAASPMARPATKEDGAIAQTDVAESYPEIGQFIAMQAGDLKCYTTVRDRSGQEFDIGATFEVCDRQEELLDQTVRFIYSEENVPDCESAEPCGRTRQETLVSDVVELGTSWQVLSNGTWTVTVGRIDTWEGVNTTGGLTYYGCDPDGNCLSLSDGFVVCRNGVCNMSWENGDYAYTLSAQLNETGDDPTTLIVWKAGEEILRAEDMEIIDSSEF